MFSHPLYRKILDAVSGLSAVPVMGEEGRPIPDTVDKWLSIIQLEAYHTRFVHNGYASMDRVRVIWELELVTVSFLFFLFPVKHKTLFGHRFKLF